MERARNYSGQGTTKEFMMGVLVIGGFGAIGKHLLPLLVGKNDLVIGSRDPPRSSDVGLDQKRARVERIDVRDWWSVARVFRQHSIHTVVHLAALVDLQVLESDLYGAYATNVLGTMTLLECSARAGVRRFVFLSSKAIWASPPAPHCAPTFEPIHEDVPPNPIRVYDSTKWTAELIGRQYREKFGLEFTALRFASIFGPGRGSRHSTVRSHSRVVEGALAGRSVTVRGGDQVDDMIYIKDVAKAVYLAALSEGSVRDSYNIGSGMPVTYRQFGEAVAAVIPGAEVDVLPGVDPIGLAHMGWNPYMVMDCRRAKEDLGFECDYGLVDAVKDFVIEETKLDSSRKGDDDAS